MQYFIVIFISKIFCFYIYFSGYKAILISMTLLMKWEALQVIITMDAVALRKQELTSCRRLNLHVQVGFEVSDSGLI